MLEAVFVFGIMNVIFEFVLLGMVPPRTRLRVLGSEAKSNAVHVAFLLLNITIHWGTLIGTMSGIGAFLCSIATVRVARLLWGYVQDDTYHRGVIGYRVSELA